MKKANGKKGILHAIGGDMGHAMLIAGNADLALQPIEIKGAGSLRQGAAQITPAK